MKKLIIIGTGGFAAEAYDYISTCENIEINFLDSIDIDEIREDLKPYYAGNISQIEDFTDCEFFIGIGDPRERYKTFKNLERYDLNYYSFIHPTALVSKTAILSEGSFLYPHTILANNSKVGPHCVINSYSAVGHDAELKGFTTLSAHVDITGNVEVANLCFFGSGSRTVPSIKVAEDTRVGAGVVVLRNTSKSDILMPNVAKKIKNRK